MLLVVLAHSCAVVILKDKGDVEWGVANSLVAVTEIAVPLFFMISGSMLLNSEKTYSLKYLFKHRLVRILVPFLVWSVISAYAVRFLEDPHPNLNHALNSVLMMYHKPVLIAYWFIYPLIAIYLLSPLLKAMVDHIDDTMLNYIVILWLIINILLPTIVRTTPASFGVFFDSYKSGRIIMSTSLGYFLLGYKLTRGRHRKINVWLNWGLIIALLAINIWISFLSLDKNLRFLGILFNLNIPLIATLLYMSMRALEPHYPRWFGRLIEDIAPLTYGVYLIHGLVIEMIQKFIKHAHFGYVFALATVVSMLVIMILSKIPGIRRIFT